MNGHNFRTEENRNSENIKEVEMVMSGLTKEFGELNNLN